jgi:hypothetical protein
MFNLNKMTVPKMPMTYELMMHAQYPQTKWRSKSDNPKPKKQNLCMYQLIPPHPVDVLTLKHMINPSAFTLGNCLHSNVSPM